VSEYQLTAIEQHLNCAPVLYYYVPVVVGGGGHQNKFAAVLQGGVNVYVKPSWDMQDGIRAVKNEVAAYEVIKLLGFGDMMGTTVLRNMASPDTMKSGPASLQVFWPSAITPISATSFDEAQITRAATFDHLILHTDRQSQNWLAVEGTTTAGTVNHLKLIDNGFAFDWPGRPPGSAFVDLRRGQDLPSHVITAVERFIVNVPSSRLDTLLEPNVLESMLSRARSLVAGRRIP